MERVALQGSYSYRPWTWGGRNEQTRTHLTLNNYSEIDNRFVQRNSRADHNVNLRLGYALSSSSSIDLQWNGNLVDNEKVAENYRSALSSELPSFTIDGLITGPSDQNNHTLALGYVTEIDSLGSNLRI